MTFGHGKRALSRYECQKGLREGEAGMRVSASCVYGITEPPVHTKGDPERSPVDYFTRYACAAEAQRNA